MSDRPQRRLDLGGITVVLIDGGGLKLDGGAMFGIIPKPLWSRKRTADEQNRISLACNCLVVEWEGDGGRRAVVETGHGPKYADKEQGFFGIDPRRWLQPGLRDAGVDPNSVTDVVLTHLHFDHAGGLTHSTGDRLVPTFPGARVHVQRQEFDDARSNFGIMHATYRPENFEPIDTLDAWSLLDGESDILPGVRPLLTPGHTRGHQSIAIAGRDRTAVFCGDVMPTAAHGGAPWNMAYDLFPLDNRASKGRLLERAANEDWLVIIGHETDTPVVRVVREKDWFRLEPVAA